MHPRTLLLERSSEVSRGIGNDAVIELQTVRRPGRASLTFQNANAKRHCPSFRKALHDEFVCVPGCLASGLRRSNAAEYFPFLKALQRSVVHWDVCLVGLAMAARNEPQSHVSKAAEGFELRWSYPAG